MLFAGLHTWTSDATTMTGVGQLGAKAYSPIVRDVACRRNSPRESTGARKGRIGSA